jgi:hypothetical protein
LRQCFVGGFDHLIFSGVEQAQNLVQILHGSTSKRVKVDGFDPGLLKISLPKI